MGYSYNALMLRHLRLLHPVPGRFYIVNGFAMHLYCTGSGSPSVILESGLGDDWLAWQKVQPALSKSARVCSYDRAGLGWSEPQAADARDAVNVARQLHALLNEAHITGPLVLVGHSAGGLYVRAFTAMYPVDVVGLVLVDATAPEAFKEIPGTTETVAQKNARHREAQWQWFKEVSGWERLTGGCEANAPTGLQSYTAFYSAEACRPTFALSWLGEWDEFARSADETAKLPCCQNIPILIISQDPDRPKPGWDARSIAANPIWASLQERLKTLSPQSRRIVARSSGHHVMIDRPDVVISGIQTFLAEYRGYVRRPIYGTTTVQ